MQKKKFQCDSNVCNAYCCRNPETNPILSVGDFIRLSRATGKPISRVWYEHGEIGVVYMPEITMKGLGLGLSLVHDPCSFVSDQNNCTVYNSRPLTCAHFPLNVISGSEPEEIYKDLGCVNGSVLNDKQLRFFKALDDVVVQESLYEMNFWNGRAPMVRIASLEDVYAILQPTEEKLNEKNENISDSRREKAVKGFNDSIRMLRDVQCGETQWLEARRLIQNLRPVLFIQLADDVAKQMKVVSKAFSKEYEFTTRKYFDLIRGK